MSPAQRVQVAEMLLEDRPVKEICAVCPGVYPVNVRSRAGSLGLRKMYVTDQERRTILEWRRKAVAA